LDVIAVGHSMSVLADGVGELSDVATEDSSESVFAVNHRFQISGVEVWDATEGGHGRWPSDAGELIVFTADVATVGHSASESTDGARSHRFLLNNLECATIPYLTRQLLVFCKLD
jgi:hypothetical protein